MSRTRPTKGRARSATGPAARRPGKPGTRPPARGGHRPAATARRRAAQRRRRLGITVALAVVLVAGLAAVAATRSHPSSARPAALPGLQTGPAPWSANTADMAARLRAIGVPPLSPLEGTAVHIHQHLDLDVDGHPVPVPERARPLAGRVLLMVRPSSRRPGSRATWPAPLRATR